LHKEEDMPSEAFKIYRYNIVDVERLFESHKALGGTTQGKRGLGHITRSSVVMLCAAWEMYIEQLLVESATLLSKVVEEPTQLPLQVQKTIAKYVKKSEHELKVLALAGTGWEDILVEMARVDADKLNTPKSGVLDPLFESHIGLIDLSNHWSLGKKDINDFVTVRGGIAHKGRHADYTPIWRVKEYARELWATAADSDNAVAEHLRLVSPMQKKPWRVTR
jgi:HEPN superfamily RiboL-PSP-like protein